MPAPPPADAPTAPAARVRKRTGRVRRRTAARVDLAFRSGHIAALGPMAEWLRRGLQILARRFDSGSGLHVLPEFKRSGRQTAAFRVAIGLGGQLKGCRRALRERWSSAGSEPN